MQERRIVITGGGTGGHIYPGIAIAREIDARFPDANLLFIGTADRLEAVLVPREGYPLETITVSFLPRKISPKLMTFLPKLTQGIFQAINILRNFRAQAVVGTGGFVTGPVIIAAYLLRIPTIIVEENSLPGLTTRVLARFATEIHLVFPESVAYFKNREKLFVTGNPVRQKSEIDVQQAYKDWGLREDDKTILIIGGSQGAHSINLAMIDALRYLPENLNIIFQTGVNDYEYVKEKCRDFINVKVKEFIYDMNAAYQMSDLVICRAGAGTISELASYGVPAIFIPFRYASENHQEYNARSVANAGGGRIIIETELSGKSLAEAIIELLEHPHKLSQMSESIKTLARPDAAKIVVDHLIELCKSEE